MSANCNDSLVATSRDDSVERLVGRLLVNEEGLTLGNTLVVNEEEGEEHKVCGRKRNPGYDVNRFCYPDRMWWLFFPHLLLSKIWNLITLVH